MAKTETDRAVGFGGLCCAVLLTLVACSDTPTGPTVLPESRPPRAVPFEPPPKYAERYKAMEECAGLNGDFSLVRWFVVPGDSWESTTGTGTVWAQWWAPHDIYIARDRTDAMGVVDHEILHELRQEPGHPVPPFGGVCAD